MTRTKRIAKISVAFLLAALLTLAMIPMSVFAVEATEEETTLKASDRSGYEYVWYDENPYGGTDYYIDYTLGDDENDGTSPETAWQNLTKANATTFEPGDRILLKRGEVWNDQQLWPKGSGEEGKPITIDAYGDESLGYPYIAANGKFGVGDSYPFQYGSGGDMPGLTNGYGKYINKVGITGAIVLRNQAYWEIHNMEISNDDDFSVDRTSNTSANRSDFNGIYVSINADLLSTDRSDGVNIMKYFRITNNYIHNTDSISSWQGCHIAGVNFQVFGTKLFTNYANSSWYFEDVVIQDNIFYNVELHAIQAAFNWFYDRGSVSGVSPNSTATNINNNYFGGQTMLTYMSNSTRTVEGWEQWWIWAKDMYSRDFYIGFNYCESIGQGAIQLGNLKDAVVEYNEVNGFLERYGQVSCGIYLWAGANTVMRYNEVYGGPAAEYDGNAFDFEYMNRNVTYEYNYSHDNKAGWMAFMGNSANSIARYNLSVNDSGVVLKNMLDANQTPTYLVNNVFIYDSSALTYFHEGTLKGSSSSPQVYASNNIFYAYNTTGRQTRWAPSSSGLASMRFTNNLVYHTYTGGTAQTNAPTNTANNLQQVDPKFVGNWADYEKGSDRVDKGNTHLDITTGTLKDEFNILNIQKAGDIFKLQAVSPCINAGTILSSTTARVKVTDTAVTQSVSGTVDWFGTSLPQDGVIDIGIYEAFQGDKAALEELIAKAAEPDEAYYTVDSYAAMVDALADANAILETVYALQEDIDAAAAALEAAIEALVFKPLDELKDLIAAIDFSSDPEQGAEAGDFIVNDDGAAIIDFGDLWGNERYNFYYCNGKTSDPYWSGLTKISQEEAFALSTNKWSYTLVIEDTQGAYRDNRVLTYVYLEGLAPTFTLPKTSFAGADYTAGKVKVYLEGINRVNYTISVSFGKTTSLTWTGFADVEYQTDEGGTYIEFPHNSKYGSYSIRIKDAAGNGYISYIWTAK